MSRLTIVSRPHMVTRKPRTFSEWLDSSFGGPKPQERRWLYSATVADESGRVIWRDNGIGRRAWEQLVVDGAEVAGAVFVLEANGIRAELWRNTVDKAGAR